MLDELTIDPPAANFLRCILYMYQKLWTLAGNRQSCCNNDQQLTLFWATLYTAITSSAVNSRYRYRVYWAAVQTISRSDFFGAGSETATDRQEETGRSEGTWSCKWIFQ